MAGPRFAHELKKPVRDKLRGKKDARDVLLEDLPPPVGGGGDAVKGGVIIEDAEPLAPQLHEGEGDAVELAGVFQAVPLPGGHEGRGAEVVQGADLLIEVPGPERLRRKAGAAEVVEKLP